MSNLATEDPLAIVLMLAGYKITGYGPGNPFSWARTTDDMIAIVGINGLAAYGMQRDDSAILQVQILRTSNDNAVIDALRRRNRSTPGGLGFSVQYFDAGGGDSISASVAFVVGPPAYSVGAGGAINTWSILSGNWTSRFVGRPATPTATIDPTELPNTPTLTPPV